MRVCQPSPVAQGSQHIGIQPNLHRLFGCHADDAARLAALGSYLN
jgi:hypothetical protein